MTTQNATTINAFSTTTETLDPSKHVNYLLGMVLGVKDFTQEFAYLSNRDAWLARDALGYGTLCGLRVSLSDSEVEKNKLTVEPGVALSPSGKFIQVDAPQCAELDKWFADASVQDTLNKAASETARLYLSLCYRYCPTDPVQIAGEPCRTDLGDDKSPLKPSRIQDDFHLDLSLEPVKPPDQTEEDALRAFVAWLRKIEVAGSGATPSSMDDFAKAIREAAIRPDNTRPTDFMTDPPPAGILLPSTEVDEYLRLAFRIWTLELRGWWRGANADCVNPSKEDCVLLAELDVSLVSDSGWKIKTLTIHEERRPYLLHLRMLQEWMLTKTAFPGNTIVEEKGWAQPSTPGASGLFSRVDHTHGTPPDPIPPHKADPNAHILKGEVTGPVSKTKVARILDLAVSLTKPAAPEAGQVLTLTQPADPAAPLEWQAAALPNLAGEVTGPLGHTHVARILDLPVASTPPAAPDANKVLRLTDTGNPAAPFEWQAENLSDLIPTVVLNGDVVNPPINNRIDKLQGNLVDAPGPKPGDVLTFIQGDQGAPADTIERKDRWMPRKPTGGVTGQFVGRSLEAEYEIVAAGVCVFRIDLNDSGFNKADMESSYNNLNVRMFTGTIPVARLSLNFTDYKKPDDKAANYIVKLTPWVTMIDDPSFTPFPFAAYFLGFDDNAESFTIGFSPIGQVENAKRLGGKLMIEISRFDPDKPQPVRRPRSLRPAQPPN